MNHDALDLPREIHPLCPYCQNRVASLPGNAASPTLVDSFQIVPGMAAGWRLGIVFHDPGEDEYIRTLFLALRHVPEYEQTIHPHKPGVYKRIRRVRPMAEIVTYREPHAWKNRHHHFGCLLGSIPELPTRPLEPAHISSTIHVGSYLVMAATKNGDHRSIIARRIAHMTKAFAEYRWPSQDSD